MATLPPEPDWPGAHGRFFYPIVPATPGARLDFVQNVALYVPLGFVLAARDGRRWLICLTAAGVSAGTEALQLVVPGRDPTAIDIVANTLGAVVGTMIAVASAGRSIQRRVIVVERWLARARRPNPASAARLSLRWALGVAAMIGLTAWLAGPSPPPPYFYVVASPSIDSAPGPLRIGAGDGGRRSFRGAIDEVRIFARARSATSIESDMRRPVRADVPQGADLVAAYSFDDGEGATLADESGRGHDGLVRGATWTEHGRFGGSLAFDGAGSEVTVASAPDLQFRRGMTLEAWVFPVGEPAGQTTVIADSREVYYLFASQDERQFRVAAGGRFGGAPDFLTVPEPIAPGQWTHLATTYDGQAIRLYVNGALASTKLRWSPHEPGKASLNGRELSFGVVPDPRGLRSLLLDDVALKVMLTCGAHDVRAAPVFSLVGVGSSEVLTVAAAGQDLQLRWATRAHTLGWHGPVHRFPAGLRDCSPGRQLEISVTGPLQAPRLALNGSEVSRTGPGLGAGWAFVFHPELLPAWLETACGLCWLGLLAFPFGFWARAARATAAGAVFLTAVIFLAPHVWRVPPADGYQLAALLGGGLLGAVYRVIGPSATAFR